MNENIIGVKNKILDLVKNYSNIYFKEKEFLV